MPVDAAKLGPFRVGSHPGAVVADHDTGWDDPTNVDYYGGHLVCESVSPGARQLLLASPELLSACEDILAEENVVLARWLAGPHAGDWYCKHLERRVARLRELVTRAGGAVVTNIPVLPREEESPHGTVPGTVEYVATWSEAMEKIVDLARTHKTAMLVQDGRVLHAVKALVDARMPGETYTPLAVGNRAIEAFCSDSHARALVCPLTRYGTSVDLSCAPRGLVLVDEATFQQRDLMRQAVARFDRLGSKTEKITAIVVKEG